MSGSGRSQALLPERDPLIGTPMSADAAAAREEALTFPCEGETLVGLLHHASAAAAEARVGVLIVVGGPQYRAGSHRHFVTLARGLAADGHPTLRFDVRGMGDSTGSQRNFEAIGADIEAAIEAFTRQAPQLPGIVLWGLCDGASAALLYLQQRHDPRVKGLCLLNPWVRSEQTQARTQVKHYYRDRLRQPEFWRKLLRGGVAVRALRDLMSNLRTATRRTPQPASVRYQDRMLAGWRAFRGPTLLVLSGNDYTAKEFLECASRPGQWQDRVHADDVQRVDLDEADHTLSGAEDTPRLLAAMRTWLTGLDPR